ncbi:MAG: EamA family transporter [Actinomycetia bacterium]|nr:EamA family transporter [Actinomycetes bacterium]
MGHWALRSGLALQRMPQIGVAAVAINLLALVVTAIIAAASGATVDDLNLSELWPFLALGAVIPGVTQILYVGAVETAGATRAQVILATSPLLAALLAVGLLGEAWNAALVVGTILVVLGGMALAGDRARLAGFRAIGIVLAGATGIAIGSRDTATRWAFTETEGNPALKAGVAIAVGVIVAVELSQARSQTRFSLGELHQADKVFALSGALMAGSYVLGFEALDRGSVTVVSPLIGTYALSTVLLSALMPQAAEAASKRLVLAAALVVAGAALVSSFRERDVPVPVQAAAAAFRAEAPTEHTRAQHPLLVSTCTKRTGLSRSTCRSARRTSTRT